MARNRIIFDEPRPVRTILCAFVAAAGVAGMAWTLLHRGPEPVPTGSPRAAPHPDKLTLPAEIAADPFGARDWPQGTGSAPASLAPTPVPAGAAVPTIAVLPHGAFAGPEVRSGEVMPPHTSNTEEETESGD